MDRRRHESPGLVGCIAEHQTLVARALVFRVLAIHALVDVGRLLADQIEHTAGGAVETDFAGVVADVENDLARQRFQIDPRAGGDFTSDNRHAGLDHRFAGHACALVLHEDRVEDGVGNLVGNLVRMAFGHGFGGKEVAAHRGKYPWN